MHTHSFTKRTLALVIFGAALLEANAQFTLTTTSYSQNFNTIGATTTAALPTGWAFSTAATFTSLTTATTQAAGSSGTGALTGTSGGGYYNFADGVTASSSDRAIGFLSSGSFASPRYAYFSFTNNTGAALSALTITFDLEKYRSGTRAFDVGFATSADAATWTTQSSGSQSYASDANNTTIPSSPMFISKSVSLTNLDIAVDATYYLRWSYTGTGGSTNAQALGIDNVTLTATQASAVPEPSTYAALFGALALVGAVFYRRRSAT